MKKFLMIIFMITSTASLMADLRFNESTGKYYTTQTVAHFNAEKYHNLALELFEKIEKNRGSSNLDHQIFSWLRILSTPEALCLLEDLKIAVKTMNKDVQAIR